MADGDARPLTDEERAELEALRAEKAHREEQERARRERAELEALRAERREVEKAPVAEPAASPAPKPAAGEAAHGAPSGSTGKKNHERTFGERMVLSEGEDDDGMPSMPPAQKITIGICLVVALCVVAYIALSNLGMLG
ncbi:hypothetical protein [uncultured Enorma sp.]|uniref:hypothetical protein n=1 Tax=uncultured Enorma sp. TaxID=1714346 RepID=UPI0026DB684D|nr:hypothetical protein [uncultured Enorma sp.]